MVGQALGGETLDQCDHLGNMVRGADEMFRHFQAESSHVLHERLDILIRVFADATPADAAFWMMRSSTSVRFIT